MVCLTRSSPTAYTYRTTLGLLSEANMSLIEELPISQLVVCTSTCMGSRRYKLIHFRSQTVFHKTNTKACAKSLSPLMLVL